MAYVSITVNVLYQPTIDYSFCLLKKKLTGSMKSSAVYKWYEEPLIDSCAILSRMCPSSAV